MVKIRQTGSYESMLENLYLENEEFRDLVKHKVNLFKKNPSDTRITNHPLTKSLEGKWALSVTDDIRIVYEWIGKQTVRFLVIGTHKEVYK